MEKLHIKSLTVKFALISISILALITVYIYVDMRFGDHMSDKARRVNLAGKERMLMRSMAYNIRSFTEFSPSFGDEMYRKGAKKAMDEYEKILRILDKGNKDQRPIPEDDTLSRERLNLLMTLWEETQKPALRMIMDLPHARRGESCDICHHTIRDNLATIDSLVQFTENHHAREFMRFNRLRVLSLIILFVLTLLIIFYFRKTLILPILKLRDSTKEIAAGNFDIKVTIKSKDELGDLANSFNKMSEALSANYKKIENLASFAEKTPNPVFECDCEGQVSYMNPATFRFISSYGMKITDLLPSGLCEIIYGLKEKGQELTYKVVKAGGIVLGEFIHILPDKDSVRIYAYDITEHQKAEKALKESEAKYRELIEQLPAVTYIAALDETHSIIYISPQIVDILGFPMSEWISDPNLRQKQTHPDDKVRVQEEITKRQASNSHISEYRMISNDGRVVWFHDEAKLIYNKAGKPLYYQGFMQEITAQKELENQFMHSQKMEAIGTLTGGVAHDFNNFLTAIIGYSSVVQMKFKEDPVLLSYIDQILASAERAAELTQRLLAFSRKQITSPRLANLNQIIGNVGKFLTRLIGERIELRTLLTDKDLNIIADIGQIEQVVINLCTNARDAMPEGGCLTIETDTAELGTEFVKIYGYGKAGNYAVLSVTDTGTGIDEDVRQKIFEPFFTTKETGKGTGLGLSMVYSIVKQHNGYINVYSEAGNGTVFRIYLPLAMETSSQPELLKETGQIRGGSETILLADDDAGARESTKALLEEYGYRIITAVDGEDAITKFRDNRDAIRVLISDIIMPKKNGREVYKEIKKAKPSIAVIFTSGYTEDVIHKSGIVEEGLRFISKPVSIRGLLKALREELDKKS